MIVVAAAVLVGAAAAVATWFMQRKVESMNGREPSFKSKGFRR